jgi:AcrR family transcriptional regulator
VELPTKTSTDKVRRRDPERTKAEILEVAMSEFAEHGFAGARVDEIASITSTTKRMIYYYFESKEGLYLGVLEAAYESIRRLEQTLDVEGLHPVEALRKLAESTYDHHTKHADFIRLVAIENVHKAKYIKNSETINKLNSTAIGTLEGILQRGVAIGVFRTDVDALDVHMMISSYCVFQVANRYTFQTLFGRDLLAPDRHAHYRRLAGDCIVAAVTASAPRGPRFAAPDGRECVNDQ